MSCWPFSARTRGILVAAVCGAFPLLGRADDIVWNSPISGNWGTPGNWLPTSVPGPSDQAILPDAGTTVNLGGIARTVHQLTFAAGSEAYDLVNGSLAVRFIHNGGDHTNRISLTSITGFDAGSYHLALSPFASQIRVHSPIIDAGGGPLEVHANAMLDGNSTYTGRTQAWQHLELVGGNGRISGSPLIDVWNSTLRLDNTFDANGDTLVNDFHPDRLGNTATVRLQWGSLELSARPADDQTLSETIGRLELARGASRIALHNTSADVDRNLHLVLSNVSRPLMRDATSTSTRGTAIIEVDELDQFMGGAARIRMAAAPDGMIGAGTIQSVVPYLTSRSDFGGIAPVTYDPGNNGTIGDSDDVGLRPLIFDELTDTYALTSPTQNASANTSFTVDSPLTVNSITFTESPGVTLDDQLTITSGAIFSSSSGYELFNGGGTLNFGTAEGIVHLNNGSAQINVPISGSKGLTLAGPGELRLGASSGYTGGTVVNNGRLILGADGAAGSGGITVVSGTLDLDYEPEEGQVFTNNLEFHNVVRGPFFSSSGQMNLRVREDVTIVHSGRFEGDGVVTYSGNNSRLILTNTTPNPASRSPYLVVSEGATLQVDGHFGNFTYDNSGEIEVLLGGTLAGVGTIDGPVAVVSNATVAPGGESIGTITIRRLQMSLDSLADFQLGGLTAGTEHDVIHAGDGGVNISADIVLRPANGFVPQAGDRFELIVSDGGLQGEFEIIDEFALPHPLRWISQSSSQSLEVIVGGRFGDANLDNVVDIYDLRALALHYNQPGGLEDGDFDYNNFVDVNDLALLARFWQDGVGEPLANSTFLAALEQFGIDGASVPEPAAALPVAAFLLGGLRRRRRGQCSS